MFRGTRRSFVSLLGAAPAFAARGNGKEQHLRDSFRRPQKNGWIYVHLEGAPRDIGFQHGYLLSKEIATAHRTIAFEMKHDTEKEWTFFRNAAKEYLWPKVDPEYREELQGIADGLAARHVKLDLWDMVAMNAWLEWSPYFLGWYDRTHGIQTPSTVTTADRCSAFVATGSYTRDGRPVIGHNAWTGYTNGVYWNIIFDIHPAKGHRMLMDGYPGLIHSGDDFGISAAGIMITETTITQFEGFDPDGAPEFMRARKAMQYASSIDEFARILSERNNGGYANNWLAADRKTGEIASLELGLKNVTLRRSRDGYFCGANFPVNEKLAREETKFDMADKALSPNARRVRWDQLMMENRGNIDVAAGQRFLSDHVDSITGKQDPNERTLCGHNELSPRGIKPWQAEFGAAGAVQAKVTDAAMAERMTFTASMGHSCGMHFKAAAHLKNHPEFAWQKPYLRDLDSHPWTVFRARTPL
ncbi:MAG TPA: C45 family peptidase [Bryobacteraceae bacterium]|nr:C45 family peptidase [Bryobacteraceae bacterium]